MIITLLIFAILLVLLHLRYFSKGNNMSKIIEAIYENGVLKPTKVLKLGEHQVVKIAIVSPEAHRKQKIPPAVKKIIRHLKSTLPTRTSKELIKDTQIDVD